MSGSVLAPTAKHTVGQTSSTAAKCVIRVENTVRRSKQEEESESGVERTDNDRAGQS